MLGISPSSPCTIPSNRCGVWGGNVGLRRWQPWAVVPVLFRRNGILWMIEGHGRSIKFDLQKQSLICFPKSISDYVKSCLEVPQWEEAGFPSGHECWCVWFCCFSVQWKERFNPVTIELNKMVLCSAFLCLLKLKMKFKGKTYKFSFLNVKLFLFITEV